MPAVSPLRPVGTDEADGASHVLVDGAGRPTTSLLLSHWPGTSTPRALARDLSTETVLAYLRTPSAHGHGAALATCDHLDEDGLASLFALAFPVDALALDEGLTGLARAGDFDVVTTPRAGRAAWALRALVDPARTPLAGLGPERPDPGRSVCAAGIPPELLELVGALAADPDPFEELWGEEEAAFRAGLDALERGRVHLDERPEAGLLVATCDARLPAAVAPLGHGPRRLPVHPAVLHGASGAPRVLVVHGGSFTYYDRYETWVAYVSRTLPARRDLTPLAARLGDADAGAAWTADPPSALVPVLASQPPGESRLPPGRVVDELVAHLASAPAAWSPHAGSPAGEGGDLSRSAAPRGGTSGRARLRWRGRHRGRPSA